MSIEEDSYPLDFENSKYSSGIEDSVKGSIIDKENDGNDEENNIEQDMQFVYSEEYEGSSKVQEQTELKPSNELNLFEGSYDVDPSQQDLISPLHSLVLSPKKEDQTSKFSHSISHQHSNTNLLFPLDPPHHHAVESYNNQDSTMSWLPTYVKRNIKNNFYTIKKIKSSASSQDYVPILPYSLTPHDHEAPSNHNKINKFDGTQSSMLETENSFLLLHQQSQISLPPENYNEFFLKSYSDAKESNKTQIQPIYSSSSLHSSSSFSLSPSYSKRKSIVSFGNVSLQRSMSPSHMSSPTKSSLKNKCSSIKKNTKNNCEERWFNVVSYPKYHDAIEALKYFSKFLNLKLLPPGYDIDLREIQKLKSHFSEITQINNEGTSNNASNDNPRFIKKKISDYNYRSNRTFNSKLDYSLSHSYIEEIELSKELHKLNKIQKMSPQSNTDLIRMRRSNSSDPASSSSNNRSTPIILSRVVCDRSCQQFTVQFNSEVAQKKILKKIVTNNNIRNSDNSLSLHLPKKELFNLVLKNSTISNSKLIPHNQENDEEENIDPIHNFDSRNINASLQNIKFESRRKRPPYPTTTNPSSFTSTSSNKNVTSNFSVQFNNNRPQSAAAFSNSMSLSKSLSRPQSSSSLRHQ